MYSVNPSGYIGKSWWIIHKDKPHHTFCPGQACHQKSRSILATGKITSDVQDRVFSIWSFVLFLGALPSHHISTFGSFPIHGVFSILVVFSIINPPTIGAPPWPIGHLHLGHATLSVCVVGDLRVHGIVARLGLALPFGIASQSPLAPPGDGGWNGEIIYRPGIGTHGTPRFSSLYNPVVII